MKLCAFMYKLCAVLFVHLGENHEKEFIIDYGSVIIVGFMQ